MAARRLCYEIDLGASAEDLQRSSSRLETAATDRMSSGTNRRVWRMTTDTPMGSFVEGVPPAAAPAVAKVEPSAASKRMLKAPAPPSWQASSMDLLTGCSVSEVGDTLPGGLFNEWFGDDEGKR